METRRKKVVITGGAAAILLLAVTVIPKNNASVKDVSRDKVESNPPTSSVITTTDSPTQTVTTTSSRVTTSPKAKTTTKTTEKDISESSSSPEVTTTTVTTEIPKAVQTQPYYVETTAGYTWSEYSVDYVETSIKETTTTTAASIVKDSEETTAIVAEKTVEEEAPKWDGPVLNSYAGIVSGPSGNETYYNLNMSGVVANMESLGYDYDYWVRDDGVKMYGDYVMCAADLSTRPKGTIVETSLGEGIVCDTGGFVNWDPDRLDIATTW